MISPAALVGYVPSMECECFPCYEGSQSQSILPYSLWDAATDLLGSMRTAYNANRTVPTSFVVRTDSILLCPKNSQNAGCTGQKMYTKPFVDFGEIVSSATQSNGNLVDTQGGSDAIQGGLAITNLFQVMNAAIRLDIGNVRPNNFMVNSSVINTIASINQGNDLYDSLAAGGDDGFTLPVFHLDQTSINAKFDCKFTVAKPWSEILISVFVATVSMLGSGWAAYLTGATYLATRENSKSEPHSWSPKIVYTHSFSHSECL